MQQILVIYQWRTNTTKTNVENTEEQKLHKALVPHLLETEFRGHMNCFTFDIFRYRCEESPHSLQSERLQITLDCNVQWPLESVNPTTELSDWLRVCVCVGVHVGACVRVKAGTNPPNKHVSSHLWLDPAGNQDSTLQMLPSLPEEPVARWEGKRCVLFICLASSEAFRGAHVKVPAAPRAAVPPRCTCSILRLLQSAGLRLKVNTRGDSQSRPMMTRPMLIKISLRLRKRTKLLLPD